MFYTAETLATNSRLQRQWDSLWATRNIYNTQHNLMINQYRNVMDGETLAANQSGGFSKDFWKEVDNNIIQLRDQETGMEIVNDLMGLQTVLPIGKTAKLYNVVGDIADDVSISIDGQAPYSHDHTDYGSDGDPIPVFTAGFGVNWRHAAGLSTVGIDLVLDSQTAKMRQFNKKVVNYFLNGDASISVEGYKGQGLKNHRNTAKIDLGASGANIDLTTADLPALLAFFGFGGAFGQTAFNNKVDAYDVMWVSYEAWGNLIKPVVVSVGAGAGNSVVNGRIIDTLLPYAGVKEIRPTYALKGSEFIAYQRRKDVVTPLVGMATGVVPKPRFMPQENYNFQIMSAAGLQITRDSDGKSGVVYGAKLS
ncbi:TPA: hypothetical protein SMT72_002889 [Proteus mirabilis]|uniref:major capsid protein n=1 Tax=Proteus mirabilis TaxID=584 RepID=UPI001F048398|nr:major capsid protein [Proteus mirabilis]ELA7738146.1 hypothetical protein [Proteus mirabilis]MDF7435910.1 DUF6260 family protein [Proteus mirabilis]MDF7455645.1 DUF6260 family protein [Proteus mirabilis]MDF7465644.1 DUF6260 family protein [Proteus mirabilis]WDQ23319.1 DUF6260 family protein [Proteus mirabilis]